MILDGDAARAARREARGKPPVYRLGGKDYTFPVEMTLDALDVEATAIEEGWSMPRYRAAMLKALMGDEQWQRFRATPDLSDDDLADAWKQLLSAYAVTEGESDSSPDSSATGGESSKPKSSGSTKRTRGGTGPKAASAG